MMLIKMLYCWTIWETASHTVYACKQVLLDLQTKAEMIQEAPGVVIMVAATLVVVQGVVDSSDRGESLLATPTMLC